MAETRALGQHTLKQIHKRTSQLRRFDGQKSPCEALAFATCCKLADGVTALRTFAPGDACSVGKKPVHITACHLGNNDQTRRGDAIEACLIFLDLLEGYAEGISELGLA